MRFRDLKKEIPKILPSPWMPGYYAMLRGSQTRRNRDAANRLKAEKEQVILRE